MPVCYQPMRQFGHCSLGGIVGRLGPSRSSTVDCTQRIEIPKAAPASRSDDSRILIPLRCSRRTDESRPLYAPSPLGRGDAASASTSCPTPPVNLYAADTAQLPGQLEGLQPAQGPNAGPVGCSDLLGRPSTVSRIRRPILRKESSQVAERQQTQREYIVLRWGEIAMQNSIPPGKNLHSVGYVSRDLPPLLKPSGFLH